MAYAVKIKKEALKVLRKMPPKVREQIEAKLEQLAKDPRAVAEGGPMGGFESRYKFRQGGWRVIYEVKDDELVVDVIKIGSRGDVYKAGGG